MQQLAEELKGQPIIVSHPVYQYWQRKYELNLRSLHWEPTESPDESGWAELDSALKDFPAKLFVWESTPSAENEAALAARGFTSLVFAPAANLPRGSSWRTEMRANLERLQKVVEKVR
jgi:zinc transport system substrate-binding protein